MSRPPRSLPAYAAWFFRQPCRFLRGVASLEILPPETLPEVAFVGRSNVGKSSLLNALLGRSDMARVSNTPGRTREMNFFEIASVEYGGGLRIVDLPGYGFAKTNPQLQLQWQKLMPPYLSERRALARVCVLIDGRHGLKDVDHDILRFLASARVPVQILITKGDKKETPKDIVAQTAAATSQYAQVLPEILRLSSVKGTGLDALRQSLAALAKR